MNLPNQIDRYSEHVKEQRVGNKKNQHRREKSRKDGTHIKYGIKCDDCIIHKKKQLRTIK